MIDRDGFCVNEFSRTTVEVLENHLWVWIGNKSFTAELLGHVEYVVDLNDAKMRIQTLQPWNVGQNVAAPSDVTFSGAELEFSGGRSIAFVIDGDVVDTVVRTAAEFPNVVGDLDGEAVVKISGHHEYFFA